MTQPVNAWVYLRGAEGEDICYPLSRIGTLEEAKRYLPHLLTIPADQRDQDHKVARLRAWYGFAPVVAEIWNDDSVIWKEGRECRS